LEDFQKFSNIKFHENPFCWCRVASFGRTDMRKLKVAFRKFLEAFKKGRKEDVEKTPKELVLGPFLMYSNLSMTLHTPTTRLDILL
jgi:hypothetical protein